MIIKAYNILEAFSGKRLATINATSSSAALKAFIASSTKVSTGDPWIVAMEAA